MDPLLDEERADAKQQSISKLRARRAALEAQKDPRYKGKKVLRKDLKKDNDDKYDEELANLCIVEDSEKEDEDEEGEEEDEEEEEEEYEESDEDDQSNDKRISRKLKKVVPGDEDDDDDDDEDDDEDDGSSEENEEVKKLYQDLQKKQKGVT